MNVFTYFASFSFFNVICFVFACYILIALTYNILVTSSVNLGFPNMLNSSLFFTLFLTFLVLIFFCCDILSYSTLYGTFFFNQIFLFFFLFIAVLLLPITRDFVVSKKINQFEYDILFSFVLISSVCLCFADDFLIIYLAIELQSLTFYVFATFNRNSEFATESGLKYFIFGAVISSFLLLGFALLYISFGTTSFEHLFCLVNASQTSTFFFCGVLFVLISFFFKVGAFPFHSWLCDVYDGAILSVTMLFAALPKIIIFGILIKMFLLCFLNLSDMWIPCFLFSSMASIFVGSFSALYQKRLKRLFAYSTISHTGFILLGFATITPDSTKALIFYIFLYTLLTVLLFSILIFSVLSVGRIPAYISNWTGTGKKNYIFALSFALTLFSITGIPPLAGFFSKFMILLAFIGKQYVLSATVIVIISSISAFYYLRLIKIFFFVKSSKNHFWISNTKRSFSEFIIGLLMFFNIFFACKPECFSLIASILSLVIV